MRDIELRENSLMLRASESQTDQYKPAALLLQENRKVKIYISKNSFRQESNQQTGANIGQVRYLLTCQTEAVEQWIPIHHDQNLM